MSLVGWLVVWLVGLLVVGWSTVDVSREFAGDPQAPGGWGARAGRVDSLCASNWKTGPGIYPLVVSYPTYLFSGAFCARRRVAVPETGPNTLKSFFIQLLFLFSWRQ